MPSHHNKHQETIKIKEREERNRERDKEVGK
jgi:hypothetical protein